MKRDKPDAIDPIAAKVLASVRGAFVVGPKTVVKAPMRDARKVSSPSFQRKRVRSLG